MTTLNITIPSTMISENTKDSHIKNRIIWLWKNNAAFKQGVIKTIDAIRKGNVTLYVNRRRNSMLSKMMRLFINRIIILQAALAQKQETPVPTPDATPVQPKRRSAAKRSVKRASKKSKE